MKFYRVHYLTEGGNSGGFSWHTSLREAAAEQTKALRDDREQENHEYDDTDGPEIEEIDVPTGKRDLLKFLNEYAAHPDNG